MALFTASELTDLLGKDVTEQRAGTVERVVWGWLKPILGWTERPDDVPDELFSWAVELGAIAHENPAGLDAKTIGPFSDQYSSERRAAILEEIRNSTLPAEGASSGGRAVGCFPDPLPYPDPAW